MDGNGTNSSGDSRDGVIALHFYLLMAATCVTAPLALMGLIGNIIAFNIFGKMERQNAGTFLLRCLAVVDSCYLLILVPFFNWYVSTIHGNGWIKTLASSLTPFMVVLVEPLYRFFLLVNAWTSVVIGINRYIAVCRPLHAARLCTISHAKKQIACVLLFSFACLLPRFLEYRHIGGGKNVGLKDLFHYSNPWYYYIYMVGCDSAFYTLIPFSILLYVCVRLAMTLRAARRQAMNRHGTRNADTSVTTMLVVLLGIFLVCQIPGIFNRINGVLYRLYGRGHFVWDKVLIFLVWPICTIFNSSVNCLIYLTYNKQFRRKICQRCTRGSTINHDYELT